MPELGDPQIWLSLVTLTVLEIVLGIDNIVFIAVLTQRLPAERQASARRLGIGRAHHREPIESLVEPLELAGQFSQGPVQLHRVPHLGHALAVDPGQAFAYNRRFHEPFPGSRRKRLT